MKFDELFMLQLFAEDPESGEGNDTDAGTDPESGEGDDGNGAEKKYTDDDVDEIIKRKKAEWEKQKKKDESA